VADIVSPATRSRMMAGIRGKDTRPERVVRKGLFAKGFRYRLHDSRLPGKPDLVFSAYKAVILIHGCFWHRHGCRLFKWPSSNVEFWRRKLLQNCKVDRRSRLALTKAGWRVLTIWECALKGVDEHSLERVISRAARWLTSGRTNMEISRQQKLKRMK